MRCAMQLLTGQALPPPSPRLKEEGRCLAGSPPGLRRGRGWLLWRIGLDATPAPRGGKAHSA